MKASGTAEPSGRIRLKEHQARLVWDWAWRAHGELIHRRYLAKQEGLPLTDYQRQLTQVDHIKAELMRTAEEMGWVLHEYGHADPEGTGAVGPTPERE
jgi:hypothetical protein